MQYSPHSQLQNLLNPKSRPWIPLTQLNPYSQYHLLLPYHSFFRPHTVTICPGTTFLQPHTLYSLTSINFPKGSSLCLGTILL